MRRKYAVSAPDAQTRGKSTTQSHRAPVFYVDLCLPEGASLKEAVHQARTEAAQQEAAGVNIQALESAARLTLANGSFEETIEDVPAIIEEFYPAATDEGDEVSVGKETLQESESISALHTLSERLAAKAEIDSDSWMFPYLLTSSPKSVTKIKLSIMVGTSRCFFNDKLTSSA